MIDAAILAQVPGCEAGAAPLVQRALAGGRGCNDVRYLQTAAGRFVLRRRLPPLERPGADPRQELAAHRAAAAAGLAPAIVAAAEDGRWLLMEYLPGAPWRVDDLARPAAIEALGECLAHLHGLAVPDGMAPFDPLALARRQLAQVRRRRPQALAEARQLVARVEPLAGRVDGPVALCHGDLQVANCIGLPPRLVDWEYAQATDPLHDIACLLGYYPALQLQLPRLLAAAGQADAAARQRLGVRQVLFCALDRLWVLAQPGSAG